MKDLLYRIVKERQVVLPTNRPIIEPKTQIVREEEKQAVRRKVPYTEVNGIRVYEGVGYSGLIKDLTTPGANMEYYIIVTNSRRLQIRCDNYFDVYRGRKIALTLTKDVIWEIEQDEPIALAFISSVCPHKALWELWCEGMHYLRTDL